MVVHVCYNGKVSDKCIWKSDFHHQKIEKFFAKFETISRNLSSGGAVSKIIKAGLLLNVFLPGIETASVATCII